MVKVYLEENKCYGRDSKGKNRMLYAFQNLKILKKNDFYSIVKPLGKGNYNKYLVRNSDIVIVND